VNLVLLLPFPLGQQQTNVVDDVRRELDPFDWAEALIFLVRSAYGTGPVRHWRRENGRGYPRQRGVCGSTRLLQRQKTKLSERGYL